MTLKLFIKSKKKTGNINYKKISCLIRRDDKNILHTFDSVIEYKRYQQLLVLMKANEIVDLVIQPQTFILLEKFKDKQGKTHQPIKYTPDFMYKEVLSGKIIYEEVKSKYSKKIRDYSLRSKLFIKYLENVPNTYFKEILF